MSDSFLPFLQCLNIVLAFAVDGKITPPLTGDFRPSQLLESTVQIHSDITPRYGRFLRLSICRRFLREGRTTWVKRAPSLHLTAALCFSLYIQKFATMGVNTEYFQQAVEIQGKVLTKVPMKFDAKIDMKLKNIKIETNPCHEETELVVGRYSSMTSEYFVLLKPDKFHH